MVMELRPKRGGFLRPFGCGIFIRAFLLGYGPYGTPAIDPSIGAAQSEIFYLYKSALIREIAVDRATRDEERLAKREKRAVDPDNIDTLIEKHLRQLPFKSSGCRYHSFVVYFSNLQRLGWVKFTGTELPSKFQAHYPKGQPRKYFRITSLGMTASEAAWANPYEALYGRR